MSNVIMDFNFRSGGAVVKVHQRLTKTGKGGSFSIPALPDGPLFEFANDKIHAKGYGPVFMARRMSPRIGHYRRGSEL